MGGERLVELEWKTSRVELINWTLGAMCEAVRVDWRPFGSRHWNHFNVMPEPGQSLEELEELAGVAAQMVYADQVTTIANAEFTVRAKPGGAT